MRRAHALQEQRQLDDLRLGGAAVEHGSALGEHRREQNCLGGSDRWIWQLDVCPLQSRRFRFEPFVGDRDLRPHLCEGTDMEIDRPGSDVVPSDQGNKGLADRV